MTTTTKALIESAPANIREAWLSLNDKQRALAAALPMAKSKEAAFLAAGYAASTARKTNQNIPQAVADVAAYIAGAALKSAVLGVQEVLGELSHSVRFDPIDIFDEHDCIKPVTQWPEHARRAMASVEVFEEWTKGKEPEFLGRTKKVKFIGKVDAADKLLRALGAYAPEKVEHTHRIEGLSGLLAELAATGADTGPGPAASRRG